MAQEQRPALFALQQELGLAAVGGRAAQLAQTQGVWLPLQQPLLLLGLLPW